MPGQNGLKLTEEQIRSPSQNSILSKKSETCQAFSLPTLRPVAFGRGRRAGASDGVSIDSTMQMKSDFITDTKIINPPTCVKRGAAPSLLQTTSLVQAGRYIKRPPLGKRFPSGVKPMYWQNPPPSIRRSTSLDQAIARHRTFIAWDALLVTCVAMEREAMER